MPLWLIPGGVCGCDARLEVADRDAKAPAVTSTATDHLAIPLIVPTHLPAPPTPAPTMTAQMAITYLRPATSPHSLSRRPLTQESAVLKTAKADVLAWDMASASRSVGAYFA